MRLGASHLLLLLPAVPVASCRHERQGIHRLVQPQPPAVCLCLTWRLGLSLCHVLLQA